MLDYYYGFITFGIDFIYKRDNALSGCRVEICKGFIKKKNFNVVYKNAGQRNALLLTSAQGSRHGFQKLFYVYSFSCLQNFFMHFFCGGIVIFQCKGNVFCNGEANELTVCIL